MHLSLNLGNFTIEIDRAIEQLNQFEIYSQLLQEIVAEDLVEEMAMMWSIDLNYTSIEFAEKYAEIEQLPDYQGMNQCQLGAICDRELRWQKFKLARWGDEVKFFFDAQGGGFDRVVLSILQVMDGSLAQELFFRIQSGEQSFTEIALDYSQGVHAANGGILGPLLLRELAPGIREIVEQLKPGELSPLFQIDRYYTYFRLDEREAAQLDDRMQQFILDELFSTWLESQISMQVGESSG